MGAIAGGLAAATGGASLTAGQLALQSAVGQIPGPNINLGGGFYLSISTSLMMGTQGFALGANVGVGYLKENFDIGLADEFVYVIWNFTGAKGLDSYLRYGIGIGDENFNFRITPLNYKSGETSQPTSKIGFSEKN